MCLSYCRLRVPKNEALARFARWMQLSEIGPLVETTCTKAVYLACDEQGCWRGQALFVSEVSGWTLFQDLSGGLNAITAEKWRDLAQGDDLMFAGYNDAICQARLVFIRGGSIVRDFLDYRDAPASKINIGRLEDEKMPLKNWLDIASSVDSDDLGFAERGWLWVYGDKPWHPPIEENGERTLRILRAFAGE